MTTPKFFDNSLAGASKGAGVFADKYSLSQKHPDYFNQELIDTRFARQDGSYSASVTVPVYFAPRKALLGKDKLRPIWEFMHQVAQDQGSTLYTSLQVHSIGLKYKGKYNSRYLVDADIVYQVGLWDKDNSSKCAYKVTRDGKIQPGTVTLAWTENPLGWLEKTLKANHIDIPTFTWMNWQSQISLADLLTKQASYFKTNFVKLFKRFSSSEAWDETVLHNILYYKLPLGEYKIAYDNGPKNLKDSLLASNEYMLLIADLTKLYNIRKQLPTVKKTSYSEGNYNPQQREAIVSDSPLNLLQSVAGSGKSHTILGRINYLLKRGVPDDEITALSFTNAAADHIKDKTQGKKINSLTIAKMIHDIYQSNFNHQLSTLDTLINSVNHAMPITDMTARQFVQYLWRVRNGEKQNQTQMLYFIQKNYNKVIDILNTVGQTTLELEEIISYINTDNPKWHDPYNTKFLIVDEVQDTSIFQFIYLLHYAAIKRINVFFVGDASQTLYEFRDADPEALNLLESTNYFKAFKLETNYRSTPEILLYANQMLSHISANRYAHLMLQPCPDNNTEVTKKSFTSCVIYIDTGLENSSQLTSEGYATLIKNNLGKEINKNLAKHEQTAFLSYTQKNSQKAANALHQLYPNAKVAVLSPARTRTIDLLSKYIAQAGSEMLYLPGATFANVLMTVLKSKVKRLVPRGTDMVQVQEFLKGLSQDLLPVYKKLQTEHKPLSDKVQTVQQAMLDYEIKYNYDNQKYFDDQSEDQTANAKDADFVISTIHSTKGLEFDHTVILVTNSNCLTQEQRRLYYVALTRAKKSEAILEISPSTKTMHTFYQNLLGQMQK